MCCLFKRFMAWLGYVPAATHISCEQYQAELSRFNAITSQLRSTKRELERQFHLRHILDKEVNFLSELEIARCCQDTETYRAVCKIDSICGQLDSFMLTATSHAGINGVRAATMDGGNVSF